MKRVITLVLLVFTLMQTKANNVKITNVSTTVSGSKTLLHFTVQWDNSWRGGPGNNYDAVWVFVKYKTDMGWYSHLDMVDSSAIEPAGLKVDIPADHKGCFVYRSADGQGNIAASNITVGVNQKPGSYDVKVFGLEMVYIPQGPFYLGYSGGNSGTFGLAGSGGAVPYQVTSATPPYIGTGNGYLYDGRVAGNVGFGSSTWPTGYNAFYIMKYELSQGGYRDFLNSLPGYSSTYLGERADSPSVSIGARIYKGSPATFRNNLAIASTSGSEIFGLDASGNGTFNEANDGEWVAANFLYWSDAAAFLDWAALRPMTEFEYEKAVNGPDAPNYPAFATGTYYVIPNISNKGILNAYTSSETVTHDLINNFINTNEFWGSLTPPNNVGQPLRSGFVADATSTRMSSGGSYYGVMELSGNVWEPVVTCANVAGRSFTGNLGDGIVSGIASRANQPSWPGVQNTNTAINTAGEVLKFYTAGISKKGGGFDRVLYDAITTANADPAIDAYPITRANAKAYGCRGVRQQ